MAKENEKWWRTRKTEADERSAALDRRLSAKKGEITKLKTRVGNGVCLCCNRTFINLQRHIKSQHPTFQSEEEK